MVSTSCTRSHVATGKQKKKRFIPKKSKKLSTKTILRLHPMKRNIWNYCMFLSIPCADCIIMMMMMMMMMMIIIIIIIIIFFIFKGNLCLVCIFEHRGADKVHYYRLTSQHLWFRYCKESLHLLQQKFQDSRYIVWSYNAVNIIN